MTDTAPIRLTPHPSLPAVATLTLNRPAALNALDESMVNALVPAIDQLLNTAGLRVLIVEGAGEHFMAGGDIKHFAQTLSVPGHEREPHYLRMVRRLHEALGQLYASDLILVAKVRGACAGFGMSLALGCDLTVASEEAYFSSAYKAIGLTPDGGQSYFLPRLVGPKKALELMLLSPRLTAADALTQGLINRVVKADELDSTVNKMAAQIASGAQHSMRGIKQLISQSLQSDLMTQLGEEAERFAAAAGSEDFAEGIQAFIEKRPAQFGK